MPSTWYQAPGSSVPCWRVGGGRPGGRPRTIEAVPRAILRPPSGTEGGWIANVTPPTAPHAVSQESKTLTFWKTANSKRAARGSARLQRLPNETADAHKTCPPPSNNTWGRAPLRQSLKNLIEIKTVRSNLTSSASIQLCFPRKRRCLMDIIHQE